MILTLQLDEFLILSYLAKFSQNIIKTENLEITGADKQSYALSNERLCMSN